MSDVRGYCTLLPGHVSAALVGLSLLLFHILYTGFLFCLYSLKNKIWVNEFR